MKIEGLRIDNDPDQVVFQLVSENQKESAQIFELSQRLPSPVKVYGKVSEQYTWAWLFIPLKKKWQMYFGNDKD